MVNLPTSCTLLDATAVLPMIPEIRARLRLTDSGHPSAEVTEVWWRNLLAVKNRKWAEYRLIEQEYSAVLPTSGVGIKTCLEECDGRDTISPMQKMQRSS